MIFTDTLNDIANDGKASKLHILYLSLNTVFLCLHHSYIVIIDEHISKSVVIDGENLGKCVVINDENLESQSASKITPVLPVSHCGLQLAE